VILTLVISPALWEGANAQEDWQWSAGFYPGSRPGEIRTGIADSFEAARAAFDNLMGAKLIEVWEMEALKHFFTKVRKPRDQEDGRRLVRNQ
jgi:hypothetical protein